MNSSAVTMRVGEYAGGGEYRIYADGVGNSFRARYGRHGWYGWHGADGTDASAAWYIGDQDLQHAVARHFGVSHDAVVAAEDAAARGSI